MIENLEQRRMFSATVALVNGELQITGTPAADNVQIDQATTAAGNAILKVKVNGVTRSFPEHNVKTITAKLGAGNDKLVANISSPMGPTDNGKTMLTVFGGAGNDYISGTNLNDRLLGEAGNDTIYGNEGFDRLNGGDGDDKLFGGYENDTLIGGKGRDYLDGMDGEDNIFASGDGASDKIVSDYYYTDTISSDGFDTFIV